MCDTDSASEVYITLCDYITTINYYTAFKLTIRSMVRLVSHFSTKSNNRAKYITVHKRKHAHSLRKHIYESIYKCPLYIYIHVYMSRRYIYTL